MSRQASAGLRDGTAILLDLAEKTGRRLGTPEDRPEPLSWLLFIASGRGPFSGQAVPFPFAAPAGLEDAVDRDTIADISAWGWRDRAARVRKGETDPLAPFPKLARRTP